LRVPTPATKTLTVLRAALPRRAGAVVVLALMIAGMQLALQTHLIEHDLLPSNHPVCEQCVVAKGVTPPPSVARLNPLPAGTALVIIAAPRAPHSLALLTERNRGPPALV
jgi:hypothetical protein